MIPTYNEEKAIASVTNEIPRDIASIDAVEVLVIDDDSSDNTVSEATKSGANTIVIHNRNNGLGIAFRNGLNPALEQDADIILNIDADGQYNAREIPPLVQPILDKKADMVLRRRMEKHR